MVAVEASKPERVQAASEALAGHAYRIRAPGSIAVSACYVAAGRFDGMFSTRDCRSVDAAAAQLIVREAGGVLSFGGELSAAPLALDARYGIAAARTDADLRLLLEAQRPGPVSEPRPQDRPQQQADVRLVDWGLAQRLALAVAGDGPRWRGTEEELRAESERAAQLVRRYTGLRHRGPLPAAELVDREEWARANLESFREMSGEVERTLAQRLQKSGGIGGVGRSIARAATGAEVGLTLGYLAQKVVGQYDVALIGPTREPRLLFVAPNLSAAQQRLDVDRELFLSWIALHETTHAIQFTAVPWLRPHLGGIASELFTDAARRDPPG